MNIQQIDPKFGAWDWYRGAVVSFSTTDANIPLPTPVAQYSGVWSADKYYDLARLPVRVGDKLTFSVLAWSRMPVLSSIFSGCPPLALLFRLNHSLLWPPV